MQQGPDGPLDGTQYPFLALPAFSPGYPDELVDGHSYFALVPAVFLQGRDGRFYVRPHYVVAFYLHLDPASSSEWLLSVPVTLILPPLLCLA